MMKGILYKENFIWWVSYNKTIGKKIVNKKVELHPEDILEIDDDENYPNNPLYKKIDFDILIITGEFNKPKVVAKICDDNTPKIIISKEADEDE